MKIVCILFVIGISCHSALAEDFGHAIQIVAPVNHSFNLELTELNKLLEVDDMKDRHIVVVSIAGAYRQGKSFLLNFFIKYLNAQYKKHDINDWLGESGVNNGLSGFKWRGGRKRETLGIWMWSDIFTHDYPNGDKVAIILIDTQGIFDDRSSMHDCTATFALSMMLSSVQCFNLMQNIKEDDLQHLELFTEYGRLALEQTHETPFQKLNFIVRDWPFAFEVPYGKGQTVVNEILAQDEEQTDEMRELRKRIAVSFEEITAFLMPHPGFTVANGGNFTGDINQISEEFRKHIKQLAPMLFAPEHLVPKRINGQKVRARDLVKYLEAYTKMFNNGALPEPKTVLMATAEASNLILFNDCMQLYSDSMESSLERAVLFMKENDLTTLHEKVKKEALAKFTEKPTLGGNELRVSFLAKIENGTEARFLTYKTDNEKKRQSFIERANLHNDKLIQESREVVKGKIHHEIEHSGVELSFSHLNDALQAAKQAALNDFAGKRMGDDEISNGHRDKLAGNLDHLRNIMTAILDLYSQNIKMYGDSMQQSLDQSQYFNQGDFMKLHQEKKAAAINQFHSQSADNEFKSPVQWKIEQNIDSKLPALETKNEAKRHGFLERANAHSDSVCNELKVSFENKIRTGLGTTFLDDSKFFNLYSTTKQSILDEFASRKMGEDELSVAAFNNFRAKLEREIDSLQANLKEFNENHRPPELRHKPSTWVKVRDSVRGLFRF